MLRIVLMDILFVTKQYKNNVFDKMDSRQFCHERKVAANIRPCTTNQFITFNGIVIIVNGLNH